MRNKEQQLKVLRNEIIDKIFKERWEDVWFFPKYKDVKGYLGTQNIIFLAINPSTGSFPSWVDKQYYRQLLKNGFKNAHLTDVFKQRCKSWNQLKTNKKILEETKGFLLKEIRIIRPILIVLLGKTYEEFYKKILKEIKVCVSTITIDHYAFRHASKKRLRAKLRKSFRRIKEKYDDLS